MPINLQFGSKPILLKNHNQVIHASFFRSHSKWYIINILANYMLEIALRNKTAFDKASPRCICNCNIDASATIVNKYEAKATMSNTSMTIKRICHLVIIVDWNCCILEQQSSHVSKGVIHPYFLHYFEHKQLVNSIISFAKIQSKKIESWSDSLTHWIDSCVRRMSSKMNLSRRKQFDHYLG